MNDKRNDALQRLCRQYLGKLRYVAKKYGMLDDLESFIKANKRHECEGTQHEVEMLARCCNDERMDRLDIPVMLDKSYYQCNNENVFDKIKKLPHVGVYSKVSASLYKEEQG